MESRQVTNVHKDGDGVITALCWKKPDGTLGYVEKNKAAVEIANGTHRYHVRTVAPEVDVKIVLRTTADSTSKNNLDSLPACTRKAK